MSATQPELPPPTTTTYAAAPPSTNALAIIGFALSFFVSVAGIVCGHLALAQIRRTGESGREFAIAALAIGYAITGFTVLFLLVYVVMALVMMLTFGAVFWSVGSVG